MACLNQQRIQRLHEASGMTWDQVVDATRQHGSLSRSTVLRMAVGEREWFRYRSIDILAATYGVTREDLVRK